MSVDHVVMFSGGIGSWAAAARVVDQHGSDQVTLLFADTRWEEPDVYRFRDDAAAQLGARLVVVADGRDPEQVFLDRRFLGNSRQANCSTELKVKPCAAWLAANATPGRTVVHVGIDWSEEHRLPSIRAGYESQGFRAEAPLCSPPYVGRGQTLAAAVAAGLTPPVAYAEGFPHANCASRCVRGGHEHWRRLLFAHPDRYAASEAMERRVSAHVGATVAILKHRSGPREGLPLPLAEFRARLQDAPSLFDAEQGEWGGCGCLPTGESA